MEIPLGKLIAVGGAESKTTNQDPEKLAVLKRILNELDGENSIIEVIPTASEAPKQRGNEYFQAFTYLGCKTPRVMNIRTKKDTENPEFIQRLKDADGIMFSGGNQNKLTDIFLKTEFLEILKSRYQKDENFVIAGTSAGAMAQSYKMIYGGTPVEALMKGRANFNEGLGFIDTAIIDSHFVNRGRFGRLAVAVAENTSMMGIGISEDTGVIITEGRYLEIIGSGLIVLIDGKELKYNSVASNGKMLNLEHLIFHILSAGMKYDMQERKLLGSVRHVEH